MIPVDLEAALCRATTTGTMLTEPELCWLYGLAAMAPRGTAVECGVHKGGSLSVWCGARHEGDPVYAVDLWVDGAKEVIFREQMARHGLNVQALKMNSWEAASLVDDVAFCFIDADHKDGILHDIQVWPGRIIPGGIIIFHDYDVWKPDVAVKRVVDEWQAEAHWRALGRVGSAAAFMRPRGMQIGGTR